MPAPGSKQGSHTQLSEYIKRQVNIPVATVGRITEPWIANEIIANGLADACMIGRANLCDPEFANKAYDGRTDEIKPCIGCTRCLNGIMFGKRVQCSVNPSFELENEDNIPKACEKKKILVIGGGVAGLEAAYVLHKRGHEVVLCEASDKLGGQINIAAVPIAKQELCKVVKYLSNRLEKNNIEVRLNTPVTKELIHTEFKDYEIVGAYGAKPNMIPEFIDFNQWATADDILSGKAFPGQKVVILGGGSVGCELADYLAPLLNDRFIRNRDITVLEMGKEILLAETGAGRSVLVQRMLQKGIRIECNAKVTKAQDSKIYYEQNGTEHVIENVNTLVFAIGYHVDGEIEEILKQTNRPYYLIGDCNKVGNIKDAISTAYEVARKI